MCKKCFWWVKLSALPELNEHFAKRENNLCWGKLDQESQWRVQCWCPLGITNQKIIPRPNLLLYSVCTKNCISTYLPRKWDEPVPFIFGMLFLCFCFSEVLFPVNKLFLSIFFPVVNLFGWDELLKEMLLLPCSQKWKKVAIFLLKNWFFKI